METSQRIANKKGADRRRQCVPVSCLKRLYIEGSGPAGESLFLLCTAYHIFLSSPSRAINKYAEPPDTGSRHATASSDEFCPIIHPAVQSISLSLPLSACFSMFVTFCSSRKLCVQLSLGLLIMMFCASKKDTLLDEGWGNNFNAALHTTFLVIVKLYVSCSTNAVVLNE